MDKPKRADVVRELELLGIATGGNGKDYLKTEVLIQMLAQAKLDPEIKKTYSPAKQEVVKCTAIIRDMSKKLRSFGTDTADAMTARGMARKLENILVSQGLS